MMNVDRASRKENIFRSARADNNPWEIGRAQPVIIKLVEIGAFQGEVLDVGDRLIDFFNGNCALTVALFIT
jgi:hypothetical protein